ncbi:MAG: hypothetical protein OEM04_06305, partial [Flavobacteriaceae bacterium]|nr:hypothetical protein [Flavobacteriaceae bacterium]
MIKNYIKIFTLLLLFFSFQISAQQKNHWLKINKAKISNTELQSVANLKKYEVFELKAQDLSNHLKGAPHKEADLKSSNFKIQFPDANGNMILFSVKESPVMHPDL